MEPIEKESSEELEEIECGLLYSLSLGIDNNLGEEEQEVEELSLEREILLLA